MESLAEQPSPENLSSFDILATVKLLRYDIEHFGEVLPETRERVRDEELSSIAEGIDRASRTQFTLVKEGNDLVYFHQGTWRSYTAMLLTGQKVAHEESCKDFRRQFQAEWADRDLSIGYKLRTLEPGEVFVWTNAYPHEIEQTYGREFMEDCGLIPGRQMGFVYRAECLDDGSVVLETQTLDQSDQDGLAAVNVRQTEDSNAELDDLVEVYDAAIYEKTGETVYAGRTNAVRAENAWTEILANTDLIEYMLAGLENIARDIQSPTQAKQQVIKHIVGVWKAFKMRLDRSTQSTLVPDRMPSQTQPLYLEVQQAFELAEAQGDIKIGCGGVIRTEKGDVNDFDPKATLNSIFGKETSDDKGKWKWKKGICRVTACPTRPGKTKVGPCEVCVRCQAKFDSGADPTKGAAAASDAEAVPRKSFDLYAELGKLMQSDKNKEALEPKLQSAYSLTA